MTDGLRRPFRLSLANPAITIDIRKPPDETLRTVHVWKSINHKFQRERLNADIVTETSHLCYAPFISQEKMLLAVNRLQKRLPALDFIE